MHFFKASLRRNNVCLLLYNRPVPTCPVVVGIKTQQTSTIFYQLSTLGTWVSWYYRLPILSYHDIIVSRYYRMPILSYHDIIVCRYYRIMRISWELSILVSYRLLRIEDLNYRIVSNPDNILFKISLLYRKMIIYIIIISKCDKIHENYRYRIELW